LVGGRRGEASGGPFTEARNAPTVTPAKGQAGGRDFLCVGTPGLCVDKRGSNQKAKESGGIGSLHPGGAQGGATSEQEKCFGKQAHFTSSLLPGHCLRIYPARRTRLQHVIRPFPLAVASLAGHAASLRAAGALPKEPAICMISAPPSNLTTLTSHSLPLFNTGITPSKKADAALGPGVEAPSAKACPAPAGGLVRQ